MSVMKSNKTIANQLLSEGFDKSHIRSDIVHVGCSQCETIIICGVATHERGCPNARHECRGCNKMIPMMQIYCEDCV